MQKRRLILGSLLIMALLFALAACSREETMPTPTVPPTDDRTAEVEPSDDVATAEPVAVEEDISAETETDDVISADWPPQLVYSSPLPGEQVTLDGAIALRFDQPMDRASVESAFSIANLNEDGEDVAETPDTGVFTWTEDNTVIYTPSAKFNRAKLYQVTVDETARGLNGKLLEQALRLNFRTVGYLDVSQIIPADETENVQADGVITVMFNRPVVPLVTTDQQDELPQPLTLDPATEGTGEWISTSIYRFTPEPAFDGGTDYTITVNAGLTDVVGSVLAEDVVTTFRTAPPRVVKFNPADGTEQFDPTQPISITFNMPMDTEATEAAVSVSPSAEFDYTWSAGDRVLTLTPQTRLALQTTYRISVAETAQSVSGANLDDSAFARISTYPFPGVESTYPREGEAAAAWNGINVTFLSPMNIDTLEGSVTIIPEPLEEYRYDYSFDGRYLYLDTLLERNTRYEVVVSGAVEDVYGNKMGADYIWTFVTADYSPVAAFNLPPQLTQLSTSFPSLVDVVYRRVSNLDVNLYDFDQSIPRELLTDLYRVSDYDFEPYGLAGEWSYSTSAIDEELGVRTIELADGGVLPTGVYMLTLDAPELDENSRWWQNQRNLVIVADTNLVVKETFNNVHVWATDLESGEPASGLQLDFYYEGTNLGSAETDANGLAVLPKQSNTRNSGTTVIAGTPGETGFGIAGSSWSLSVEPWWFGINYGWEDERPFYAYMYTDRPIYRPGDTVNIRGVVRSTDYGRFDQPDLDTVKVQINPAYSFEEGAQQAEELTLELDENGGFSAEYTIPDGSTLGEYTIAINSERFGYESFRSFTVAEYRVPEILAVATPNAEENLRGDPVEFTVDVSYFFGGPAADLDVHWSLNSDQYFYEHGGYPYYYGNVAQPYDPFTGYGGSGMYWVADGQGKTDSNGQLVVKIPADALANMPDGSRELMFEATITDLTGFPTSARTTMVQHSAELYVGIGLTNQIYQAGTETTLDLRTLDWNGDRVGNAPIEVIIYEREWRSVRNEFNPGQVSWEPVDTEVARVNVTTDDLGDAVAAFTPEKGGSYIAEAIVTDSSGRTQTSSAAFWVSSGDYVAWRFDPQDRKMNLVLDQQEYAVGDTARILVQSPFPEPVTAWLTIERGETIEERLITVDSGTVLELPLSAEYAPNIFVTLVAVKPVDESERPWADLRLGIVEVPVSVEGLQLELALAPDQDVVLPGGEVTYEVTITDADGNPVSADFSVAVVDLAVLQLKPDNAPDILEAFYTRQPYRSQIGSGMFYSGEGLEINEPSEQMGGMGGGGGGDVAAESVVLRSDGQDGGEEVRQDFRDTAFWEARLSTDAAGRASVTVALPDNLTTWRMSSKAATVDTLVGQDAVDIIATKPVLIRPITPRFFTVGDQVSLGAVVNNNTDAPIEAAVTLEATGLIFSDDPTAASQTISVTVPANSGEVVRWPVTVLDAIEADLVFSVNAGEFSDATKPTVSRGEPLPIYRYDAADYTATAGSFDQEGRRVEAILLPQITDTRIGDVKLRLNASLASGILDGLEALDYEQDALYNCAHVSANYLLPNASMALALRDLSFSDILLQSELDQAIPKQIAIIEETQRSNGGWGWCNSSETDEYLSAYVLFALLKAQEAGYDVKGGIVANGVQFVERALVSADTLKTTSDANRQAFYLYVLATAGEDVTKDLDDLFDATRELLDPYAKGLMLSAYAALDSDSKQNELLSDLNNSVILSATGAHWEDQTPDWNNLSSDVRGTAMVIDAMATVDPENTIISNAVRWLMSARELTYWPTLHEGAWSILALTDVMQSTGELDADYTYAVDMNFEPVADGTFTPEDVARADLVTIPIDELLIDELNYLDIQRGPGDGVLYYTAHLNAFLDANEVDPVERGIVVTRQYFDAACDPEEETCEPITEVTPDQQIRVELTIIAPNSLPYVIIEDPIPAGAEAIDPNLETSSTEFQPGVGQPSPYSYGYWGWWYFNGIQFRDEKVVFSSAYLPAGTYQYTYYLQPVIPGEFQVMPTTARQEFFPEVFGRSAGEVLTIK